eukprot:6211232-Pleurochrysis_carterae.AAC.6
MSTVPRWLNRPPGGLNLRVQVASHARHIVADALCLLLGTLQITSGKAYKLLPRDACACKVRPASPFALVYRLRSVGSVQAGEIHMNRL